MYTLILIAFLLTGLLVYSFIIEPHLLKQRHYLIKKDKRTVLDISKAYDLYQAESNLVIAHISDHVFYASANKAATPLVSAEVRDNPGIYPPADVMAKLFTLKVQDPKIDRVRTRAWTKVKSGK